MYKTKDDKLTARQIISPPGDSLAEILDLRGMSQAELALRMGRPLKTINEIIKGKAAITPETAIQLERVLGVEAEFWLRRENQYRLELAFIEEAESLLGQKEWARNFPLQPMKKLGWISYEKDVLSEAEAIYHFFGVSGRDTYYNYYHNKVYETAFRMSAISGKNPYSISVWLKQGERQAEKLQTKGYNLQAFKEALTEIKNLMAAQPSRFFKKIQSLCLDAGVKAVYTPSLPQTHLHGSTRWINETPLIQLTNLYNRNDIFWFSFFHEAGHIVKHGKKDLFVEGLVKEENPKEKEADDFAVRYTLTIEQENEILKNTPLRRNAVIHFARMFNTHPAIILGRLAHEEKELNKTGWTWKFFIKVDLDLA
jgi:addiction module HigA family antidote